jgi:hypothetical protein
VTTVSTDDLRAELEGALVRRLGPAGRIERLERRPSEYRTSFPLDELDVGLAGGDELELVWKDVAREALDDSGRAAKPELLYEPLREIELYEGILADAGLGTAHCHASVVDAEAGRHWLFLERVRGVELFQVGSRETWEHVARYLAGMHVRLGELGGPTDRLLRCDAELLHMWPRRAVEFASDGRADLERIARGYERVVDRILQLPLGVIHGEFYASNVLVDDALAPDRVCPVDWEMAAVGPPLVDVAALVSGRWSDENRRAIAAAYHRALPADARPPLDRFTEVLDACRLHLAMQWLGWSADWSPPAEHATDWLREAREVAGVLDL